VTLLDTYKCAGCGRVVECVSPVTYFPYSLLRVDSGKMVVQVLWFCGVECIRKWVGGQGKA